MDMRYKNEFKHCLGEKKDFFKCIIMGIFLKMDMCNFERTYDFCRAYIYIYIYISSCCG